MAYSESTRYRDEIEYRKIADTINKVGVKMLRVYCQTKKHPVKNFDRDIKIIKHCLKYGTTNGTTVFGLSKQRLDQIMRRYKQYAEEVMEVEHD